MWDFLQYKSRKQDFNGFFQSSSEVVKAGVEVRMGVWAFRTALKICYKSFSEYLETLVVAIENFGPGYPAGYLENSDLGGEESKETTEERSQ